MRYGQIRKYDVANGPGIRTSIFVTGCTHHCPQCFNQEYQDFQAGSPWTESETKRVIEYLSHPEIEGLTLLGGEPFQNTEDLIELLHRIKKNTDKSIWIYSGYTFDQLIQEEKKHELLSLCDILVDGLFVEELKNLKLKFRGSSNQRIIDIQKSFQAKHVVLAKQYYEEKAHQ
ncbi:MAG: anaerobic ribonucleoside-triphosphate reductase activating protein [Tissierellia bacterium]|nr:anaerobic ribonucleoside-triphosphate reductase activating protein [Tissierellia bacterium]